MHIYSKLEHNLALLDSSSESDIVSRISDHNLSLKKGETPHLTLLPVKYDVQFDLSLVSEEIETIKAMCLVANRHPHLVKHTLSLRYMDG